MDSDAIANEVLQALSEANDSIISKDAFPSIDFVQIKSATDSLKSRDMVTYKQLDREEVYLTPEAEEIARDGSHEAKVFEAVRQAVDGLKISELPVRQIKHTKQSLALTRFLRKSSVSRVPT